MGVSGQAGNDKIENKRRRGIEIFLKLLTSCLILFLNRR